MRRFITDAFEKLTRGTSLRARAIKGGVWLGAGSTVEQGFRFTRNIILARLLAPEAFGLLAIILAVNSAFESFTEIGVKESIIQDPEGSQDTYLNGAWWLSLIRATGLFTMAFFAAPWVASFYESPELVPMMRLVFLSIIFNGLMSPKAYVALKEMNYRRWVIISQGGGAFGIITAIALAVAFQDVWALVIGFIAESAARCILSYIICPFRPSFKFKSGHRRSLMKFAKGMFGLPILFFIYSQADIFVVGKFFSKNDLGTYSMALSLAQIPAMMISIFINPIMMPAFSEMKGDNARVNNGIIRATSFVAFLGFPLLFFAALYGRDVLSVAYGARYEEVYTPFAILFAVTLIRTCSAPIATAYLALGQPKLHRLFTGARAVLMVLLIYPAVRLFGLEGAALASLISLVIAYVFQVLRIRHITGLLFYRYSTGFIKAGALSLPILAVWVGTYGVFSSMPAFNIMIGLGVNAVVYVLFFIGFMQMKKRNAVSSLKGIEY